MTNFIFKSQEATFKKISNQLIIIQNELRHNRQDMVQVLFLLNKLLVNKHLQTQVDDYYDKDHDAYEEEHSPPTPPPTLGTSPQTDTETKIE